MGRARSTPNEVRSRIFHPTAQGRKTFFAICVLRGIAECGRQADKAMKAFFQRFKAKKKAGFPRFRGRHRHDSFCYPQSGFTAQGKAIKSGKDSRQFA